MAIEELVVVSIAIPVSHHPRSSEVTSSWCFFFSKQQKGQEMQSRPQRQMNLDMISLKAS
jgi:hypothetical protein